MNQRIEDVKKRAAEDIARVEQEELFRPLLPEAERETAFVYRHRAFVSARLGDSYQPKRTFEEAVELLLSLGATVECQHRKGGCLSTWPEAAIDKRNLEDPIINTSHVRIDTERAAAESGVSCELEAWFTMANHLVYVSIPFAHWTGPRGLLPYQKFDRMDRPVGELQWSGIGEDFEHRWWASPGGYNRSRHWHTDESFKNWFENWKRQKEEVKP